MSARALSPSVRSLVFEVTGGALDYRPGASLQLTVQTASGMAMRRPYSIASAPGAAGPSHIELAVTRVEGGPVSTALSELPIGAWVEAGDPQTGWLCGPIDEEPKRTLLIATGSGLAPLRAIVQDRLTKPQGPALELLFGCRTPDDILWKDELAQWSGASAGRVTSTVTLSRPPERWSGRRGHVQAHLQECVERLHPELALVCGLSAMADEVERMLYDLGIGEVRTEAFDR